MVKMMSPPQLQLDLFSSVLHAYSKGRGILTNSDLYDVVASQSGLADGLMDERVPVGASAQLHNPIKRAIRWHQQTLKMQGILQHVDGERGVWRLAEPAGKDLSQIQTGVAVVGFSTDLGIAILGSAESVFADIDCPVTLVVTSPPYPLAKPRAYGNVELGSYTDWLVKTIEPVVKNLVDGGSICLNLSNDLFIPGLACRSTYLERLVIALEDKLGLHLVDRLVWHNASKPPGPVQYASLQRVMLNVGWEPVYWFTNNPRALRSDNRRVLQAHTERHLRLIQQGGEQRERAHSDGAYRLHAGRFGNETAGSIPKNVLAFGHACLDQQDYKRAARASGLPAHGAPMPLSLAKFLIEFMSTPGDLVADPFAGSQTTAKAAEILGRRWITTERIVEYVVGGAHRFNTAPGFERRIAA